MLGSAALHPTYNEDRSIVALGERLPPGAVTLTTRFGVLTRNGMFPASAAGLAMNGSDRASDIFGAAKHGGVVTPEDREYIRARLFSNDEPKPGISAAIKAFALLFPPTGDNVDAVMRYMAEETDDYTRRSAIYAISSY